MNPKKRDEDRPSHRQKERGLRTDISESYVPAFRNLGNGVPSLLYALPSLAATIIKSSIRQFMWCKYTFFIRKRMLCCGCLTVFVFYHTKQNINQNVNTMLRIEFPLCLPSLHFPFFSMFVILIWGEYWSALMRHVTLFLYPPPIALNISNMVAVEILSICPFE